MSKRQFFTGIFVASVVGSLLTFGVLQYFGLTQRIYQTVQQDPQIKFSNYTNSTGSTPTDFTKAAELATPAVVHIKTYQEIQHSQQKRGYSPFNDLLKDFFGDNYQYYNQEEDQKHNQEGNKLQPIGAGSGVIISLDGYIVTNNHVIDGADEIEVVLNDRRKYVAKLIGKDPTTDLALLKIEETGLPNLNFSDSDDVKVGEWVLAVGNPFNLTSTVTAGIVSAKARNINILKDKDNLAIESFIQTDAAVNPGNSGGALVNLKGNLIGINSAIASPTGAFAGYSFAIPANLVNKVINDLKEFGQVQRALLGVSIADVNAELAEEKELKDLNGVYIAGVREDGSAHEAGIKAGDVIIKIDGETINHSSKLQQVVGEKRPGDKISITFIRDGKEKTTKTVLKNKLGTTEVVSKDAEAIVNIFGSRFQKVKDGELSKLKLQNGVQIIEIGEGKIKESGIQKGFIVVALDKQRVYSPSDVAAILGTKSTNNTGVLLEGIYPNGQRAYYGIGW